MSQVMTQKRQSIRTRFFVAGVVGVLLAIVLMMAVMRNSRRALHQPLPRGLRLDSDTLDLGLLAAGSTASGDFRLVNNGPLTYHVDRVAPDCGCMTATASGTVVSPNASLEIPVTVHASEWGDGLRTKHIALMLTDSAGAKSTVVFAISAAVRQVTHLAVMPGHFDVPYSRSGEIISLSLFVRGDAANVRSLPSTVKLGELRNARITAAAARPEGRRSSREIGVTVRTPLGAKGAMDLRTLEIVVSERPLEAIQIPIRFHRTPKRPSDAGTN